MNAVNDSDFELLAMETNIFIHLKSLVQYVRLLHIRVVRFSCVCLTYFRKKPKRRKTRHSCSSASKVTSEDLA